jgi:hypothetical protein
VYALIFQKQGVKLDSKALLYIFIGYEASLKGYRLFNQSTKKLIKGRDVQFFELLFYENNDKITINHKILFGLK